MRKKVIFSFTALSLLAITSLLGGCGSASKEGAEAPLASIADAPKVGSDSCTNTCHAATKDITMRGSGDNRTIAGAWTDSVHHISVNGFITIGCEDCHGGGGLHWGSGPLAYPVPDYKRCQTCHKPPFFDDPAVFQQTAHANAHLTTPGAPFGPDQFFFQGGVGTDQAAIRSVPEFVAGSNPPKPVSKNQHIEECSVCHNSNQQFRYDAVGNLTKPDPANMANPTISCANCHDAHQVGKPATVAARPDGTTSVNFPIFRKSQIAGAGGWKSPTLKPTNADGTIDQSTFTSTELICAACHTKGLYKYGKSQTHQNNTFSQWTTSGHGAKGATAWNDFSGKLGAGHRTTFPLDLSVANVAAPTACFKCHNGLATIDFLGPIDPVTRRPTTKSVVWGAASAVCITCHDPHANGTGTTKNVRKPVVMTNYTGAGVGVVFGNVFLDNQPVPATTGNATICIFCHQGRESGLSLFKDKLAAGRTIAGAGFKNAHYLGTAAMLWGANAYEYAGKSYSVNASHQSTNCTGCHMANPTEPVNVGGHTWNPNPASCTTCHSAITATVDLPTYLNNSRATAGTTNYSGNLASVSIAKQIQDLQNYIIKLMAAQTAVVGVAGSGPVFYDDSVYPYFHNVAITSANGAANNHTFGTSFKGWTLPVYKAAFNLGIAVKGLPSAGASPTNTFVVNGGGVTVPDTSATLIPNNSAAVHNYKYIIQLLMDSYTDLYNNTAVIPAGLPTPAALNANRPVGARAAVNYGAYVKGGAVTYGGTYDANQ
ncbi:MAG: hypothetical protein PVSMB11_02230 [Desulfuromonadaceae bacterium]